MYMVSNPISSHFPVSVFKVKLVCSTSPPRSAPDSTDPPATGRDSRLSPANTVKLARGRSYALRVATLGEPKQHSFISLFSTLFGVVVITTGSYNFSGLTEELCLNVLLADSHQEISSVVPILPLQDGGPAEASSRCCVGGGDGSTCAGGADSCSSKFYAEPSFTGSVIVFFLAEPDQIRDLLKV